MAIDATTRIPTGVWLVAVVHTYSHHILTLFQIGRDIIFERAIAVWTITHFLTIDIDRGVHVHAIERQKELFTFHFFTFHYEMLTIPSSSARQCSTCCPTGITSIEITLYSPVVRQVETTPKGIVISHFRHLYGVSQYKKPVSVEILTLTGLYRCQSQQDTDETYQSVHNCTLTGFPL